MSNKKRLLNWAFMGLDEGNISREDIQKLIRGYFTFEGGPVLDMRHERGAKRFRYPIPYGEMNAPEHARCAWVDVCVAKATQTKNI